MEVVDHGVEADVDLKQIHFGAGYRRGSEVDDDRWRGSEATDADDGKMNLFSRS